MHELQLSAEQREIRETVRDFVAREIRPVALHPDRLQADGWELPPRLLEQASQMGLRTLALPEGFGGAGADHLTECIVGEELAAGDVGLAVTFARTWALGKRIFEAMSLEQRERYLPQFLRDERCHLAYAGEEWDPESGGWNYHRPDVRQLTVPASAAQSDGAWVVTGAHRCVGNAPLAGLIAVQARTDSRGAGLSGVSVLLIPAAAGGLTVSPISTVATDADGESHYHWFHGSAGDIELKDCRVPAEDVLGTPGRGNLLGAAAASGHGSPLAQALNLGVGRAAYEAALEYAGLRVQGGRRIIEHQAIGTFIGEMALRLETARNLVWKAAWVADHAADTIVEGALPLQLAAKAYTSQAMHEVALLAAECFGAMGVMKDMPLQKYVHDSLVFVHSDISNSTAKLRIAEVATKYTRDVRA